MFTGGSRAIALLAATAMLTACSSSTAGPTASDVTSTPEASAAGSGGNLGPFNITPLWAVDDTGDTSPGFRLVRVGVLVENATSDFVGSRLDAGGSAQAGQAWIQAQARSGDGFLYGVGGGAEPVDVRFLTDDANATVLMTPGLSLPAAFTVAVPTAARDLTFVLTAVSDVPAAPCPQTGCSLDLVQKDFATAETPAAPKVGSTVAPGTPVTQGPLSVAVTTTRLQTRSNGSLCDTAGNLAWDLVVGVEFSNAYGYTIYPDNVQMAVIDAAGGVHGADTSGRQPPTVPPGGQSRQTLDFIVASPNWTELSEACPTQPPKPVGSRWLVVWMGPLRDPNSQGQMIAAPAWGLVDLGS